MRSRALSFRDSRPAPAPCRGHEFSHLDLQLLKHAMDARAHPQLLELISSQSVQACDALNFGLLGGQLRFYGLPPYPQAFAFQAQTGRQLLGLDL